MNKIAIYILLILIYLGISKSFAPTEFGIIYIPNKQVFANYFPGAPVSVVLVDQFSTGFIIKTYFHRYHVVHLFKASHVTTVKVSKDFYTQNENNLGMTLFHRRDNNATYTTPVPAGSFYVGDKSFGNWITNDSGIKVWELHGAYDHLIKKFRWLEFRPTRDYYKTFQTHLELDTPFYGLNQEFGTFGNITQKAYSYYFNKNDSFPNFKTYIKHYVQKSFMNKHNTQNKQRLKTF